MNKLALTLGLVVFTFSMARADWVIIEKQSAAGQSNETKTQIKGDLARTDVGDQSSVIIDTKTNEMTVLMHPQKAFMKMNPDSMKGMMAMAQQLAGGGAGGESAKPTATGETEKVGDWDAEIYTWQGKMGGGKFWVSKDIEGTDEILAMQEKLMKGLGAGNPIAGLAPNPSDFPGVVVKSELTMMGQSASTELISAKQEDVSEAIFVMPEGYNEMKMPAIPGVGQ